MHAHTTHKQCNTNDNDDDNDDDGGEHRIPTRHCRITSTQTTVKDDCRTWLDVKVTLSTHAASAMVVSTATPTRFQL